MSEQKRKNATSHTTDIVTMLRTPSGCTPPSQWELAAANEIERLRVPLSERMSALQIERAAEMLREYEGQHLLEGIVAWENLNEKIKQHFRGKVRVVVDAVGEA